MLEWRGKGNGLIKREGWKAMAEYKVYCDESRNVGSHRYRLMGGIWILKEQGWNFINDFETKCRSYGRRDPVETIHFKNAPTRSDKPSMRYYECLIDTFFEYAVEGKMFFRTVIVNKEYQFNHGFYNNGDPEVGFYKLYYYLIIKRLKVNNRYHLRLADREVSKKTQTLDQKDRLLTLKDSLNAGFRKEHYYRIDCDPVITVEPRVARERRLIQLADVLMGAVGYHYNNWTKNGLPTYLNQGKAHICNYMAKKLGWDHLYYKISTPRSYFDIFYMNGISDKKSGAL